LPAPDRGTSEAQIDFCNWKSIDLEAGSKYRRYSKAQEFYQILIFILKLPQNSDLKKKAVILNFSCWSCHTETLLARLGTFQDLKYSTKAKP
jgi:hypothetical protein